MVWDEAYIFSVLKPQRLAAKEWNKYCSNIKKETGRESITKQDTEEYSKTHLDSILVFTGHSSKVVPNFDYITIYHDGYYIEALYDCCDIPNITVIDLFKPEEVIPEATIICHIINALMRAEGIYDGPMLTKETGKTLAQFTLNMFDFDTDVFCDMRAAGHKKARSEKKQETIDEDDNKGDLPF